MQGGGRVWSWSFGALVLAAVLAAWTAQASASTKPSAAEARAIQKGFKKTRGDVDTNVTKVVLSSEDDRYAAVSYSVRIPELQPIGLPRGTEKAKAPSPVILKAKGKKWKPVSKVPKKVEKDLKKRPGGDIAITGDVVAVLKRPASCGDVTDGDFYSAGVYEPGSDTYLSIEFPTWRGPGFYEALGVRSVASLAVGNNGGVPQYETGLGNDAFSPSGDLYVDPAGWGIIEATMARQPDEGGTYPQSVLVNGYWDCR